jgi:hypothetical protein
MRLHKTLIHIMPVRKRAIGLYFEPENARGQL